MGLLNIYISPPSGISGASVALPSMPGSVGAPIAPGSGCGFNAPPGICSGSVSYTHLTLPTTLTV